MKLRVITKEGTVDYDMQKTMKIVCHNQIIRGEIIRKYRDFLQIFDRFIVKTKDGKYLSISEWSILSIEPNQK